MSSKEIARCDRPECGCLREGGDGMPAKALKAAMTSLIAGMPHPRFLDHSRVHFLAGSTTPFRFQHGEHIGQLHAFEQRRAAKHNAVSDFLDQQLRACLPVSTRTHDLGQDH
jgi:hypothetical protein